MEVQESYLRNTRVQQSTEERLPVVWADGRRKQRQEIIFKKTISEKMVKKAAWN